LDAPSRLSGGLDGGQEQGDQHGDDRDDDEQFDQCESATSRFHGLGSEGPKCGESTP
jgi:hypothetical protein